jgi:hypothetical protein
MEKLFLIIKRVIRHYEIGKYQREFLQITSIVVEDRSKNSCITISYPKHDIEKEHNIIFFKILVIVSASQEIIMPNIRTGD